jgi:hypothetical protein
LPVGSILGIVNAVLAIQPVGKKPIVEPVKGIVRPFFVLPAQKGAQD